MEAISLSLSLYVSDQYIIFSVMCYVLINIRDVINIVRKIIAIKEAYFFGASVQIHALVFHIHVIVHFLILSPRNLAASHFPESRRNREKSQKRFIIIGVFMRELPRSTRSHSS